MSTSIGPLDRPVLLPADPNTLRADLLHDALRQLTRRSTGMADTISAVLNLDRAAFDVDPEAGGAHHRRRGAGRHPVAQPVASHRPRVGAFGEVPAPLNRRAGRGRKTLKKSSRRALDTELFREILGMRSRASRSHHNRITKKSERN
jgi:hypothetical protein